MIENTSSQPIDNALHLKQLLSRTESREGINAFNDLCSRGCDASTLGSHLVWIYYYVSKAEDDSVSLEDVNNQSGDLSDSSQIYTEELDLDILRQIAKRAEKLQKDLEVLGKSYLARYLTAHKLVAENDLLNSSLFYASLGVADPRFFGLINLPEFAKRLNSKRGADFDRLLAKIYTHIHDVTGDWCDEQVASILNDLFPNPDNPAWNEELLKQWRYRRRLVDPRKNQKKNKQS